ncbi:MAG: hypothetical protein ACLFO1_00110 [Spirochaetaceae bacterium]
MPALHHVSAKAFTTLALFLGAAVVVGAADVAVPRFSLASRGTLEDGAFLLDTRADVDIALEGGFKFGGDLTFSFESDQLEEDTDLPSEYDADAVGRRLARTLIFQSASITIRELFDSPLNMSYFTGRTDRFGTSDGFIALFGTDDFGTHFAGYNTFPDGVAYEGFYQIEGTGISLHTNPLAKAYVISAHTYQDPRLGTGKFSSDLRFMANSDFLKAGLFVGASYPMAAYGIYRAGLLTYFQTSGRGDVQGQFFTQLALPRFDPANAADISLEDFYFLFEPRLRFEAFSLLLTLFWHPDYYLQSATNEGGALDANIRAILGNPTTSQIRGGLDTRMTYNPGADQQLAVRVVPFLRVAASGILWDFAVRARVYPFSLQESFDGLIGITTEF